VKAKKLLFEFIFLRKWYYLIGIIVLVFTTLLASLIPLLLGYITDGLQGVEAYSEQVRLYIGLFILITLSVFALKYTWRYFLIGNCRFVECFLREKLFKHLQSLSATFYDNHKTGDLIAYAINDIQAVRMIFGFGSIAILEGVITNGASIFFMITTINPFFTLIAVGPSLLLIIVLIKLRTEIRERFRRVQKTYAEVSEKVEENIMGIRVLKAYAQEKEEVSSFLELSKKRLDTQMNLTKVSGIIGPATQITFGISFFVFIAYGSQLVANGTISLGDYVAFNSYMMLIMGPITNIARVIEVWQRGLASLKRLDDIFLIQNENLSKNEKESVDISINGSIEIKNLTFTYPGSTKKVLKNVNLVIPKGTTLGITGKSGSGKTTLVNLLLKLYPVEDGKIYIDGVDINNIDIGELREKIGCIPQEHFLFSTTITDNIAFFNNIYSKDEIELASKLSEVYENITSFPNGFETIVGERGVTLSGGQKQRISIARALIKKPVIIIMDDSLSAVDAKTEEQILRNMGGVLSGVTGLIISHRVNALRHSDKILYLENGEVAEFGSHEDLMKLEKRYFKLYQIQLEESNERNVLQR